MRHYGGQGNELPGRLGVPKRGGESSAGPDKDVFRHLLTVYFDVRNGALVVDRLEGHERLRQEHTIVGLLSPHYAKKVDVGDVPEGGGALVNAAGLCGE